VRPGLWLHRQSAAQDPAADPSAGDYTRSRVQAPERASGRPNGRSVSQLSSFPECRRLSRGGRPAGTSARRGRRIAARRSRAAARFVADSPLEGTGFEPLVPLKERGGVVVSVLVRADFPVTGKSSRGDVSPLGNLVVSHGTNSSNPASSSSESGANLNFGDGSRKALNIPRAGVVAQALLRPIWPAELLPRAIGLSATSQRAKPALCKGWLFRTARGHNGSKLADQAMSQRSACRMIRRRAAAAGIEAEIGSHTFRAPPEAPLTSPTAARSSKCHPTPRRRAMRCPAKSSASSRFRITAGLLTGLALLAAVGGFAVRDSPRAALHWCRRKPRPV
jgi:hypothetical protein